MRNIYFLIIILCFGLFSDINKTEAQMLTPYTFGTMRARELGPATSSGRITAIEALYINQEAGKKDRRLTIYVGSAAGGVYKSKDNGTTFKALFEKEKNQSIGCMALDPRHQDSVLWVGTGESNVRNSVSIGGGLYKTTDAGETWKLLGLEKVERIAKIALNSKNPDIALVAGMGALWSDSDQRGLYRTTDGGKTFEKVLYVDEKTGCADVVIDPENPSICYAAMWQFRRMAWTFNSGGPGSGLYKSIDGGKTWKKMSKDIPSGDLGRIIIAISPSKPNVIYSMIESKESGLYRSEDRGESWKRMSNAVSVTARPFYFSCLYVDPYNENRVYRPSFQLGISDDGGKTFNGFNYGGGAHADHHALWIDPENPQHLLLGTDGGVYRTFDRGVTWSQFRNLPLAQFYRISHDFEEPYNVFGGLQDNGSWMVPHKITGGWVIQNRNWEPTGWGDGFAVVRDRANPDILYFESQGGSAVRRHISSNEVKPISPFEEKGEKKLRFNWNTPIAQSPTNNKTLYIGSQYLHRSYNHGDTWERISPDLTTNDSAKYNPTESGGVTKDNTSAENHCTIYSIAESPIDEKIIWIGTDDGNIQVSTSGGKSWENITASLAALVPKHTWVSCVEPSHFDKATIYATLDNHTRGDHKTYILKSTNYGRSWKQLTSDSLRGFAHVIREDLVNKDLLFVGTELGLFVSIDGGETWANFRNEIPNVPVRDMVIHPKEHDLIIATHGRGVFIIDDINPLRALKKNVLAEELVFLPTRPTEMSFSSGFQEFSGSDEFNASNPNNSARIAYYLKARHMIGEMKVDILDKKTNQVIATIPAAKRKGVNLLSWDMSTNPPRVAISQNTGGGNWGYTVLSGEYTVRVTKNGKEYSTNLVINEDKKSIHKPQDRIAQYEAMKKMWLMIDDLAFIAEQTTSTRDSLRMILSKAGSSSQAKTKGDKIIATLDSLHKTMIAEKNSLFADTEDKLREKLANIYGTVSQFAGKPSEEQMKRIGNLDQELFNTRKRLNDILTKDIKDINILLKAEKMPEISLLTREQFDKQEG